MFSCLVLRKEELLEDFNHVKMQKVHIFYFYKIIF